MSTIPLADEPPRKPDGLSRAANLVPIGTQLTELGPPRRSGLRVQLDAQAGGDSTRYPYATGSVFALFRCARPLPHSHVTADQLLAARLQQACDEWRAVICSMRVVRLPPERTCGQETPDVPAQEQRLAVHCGACAMASVRIIQRWRGAQLVATTPGIYVSTKKMPAHMACAGQGVRKQTRSKTTGSG
jgi:hypothetical protein